MRTAEKLLSSRGSDIAGDSEEFVLVIDPSSSAVWVSAILEAGSVLLR